MVQRRIMSSRPRKLTSLQCGMRSVPGRVCREPKIQAMRVSGSMTSVPSPLAGSASISTPVMTLTLPR